MSPEDAIAQMCVNPRPTPFSAGTVSDLAGCSLHDAERACNAAVSLGIALQTKDRAAEGRGTHLYVGVRDKALPYAKKRLEHRQKEAP